MLKHAALVLLAMTAFAHAQVGSDAPAGMGSGAGSAGSDAGNVGSDAGSGSAAPVRRIVEAPAPKPVDRVVVEPAKPAPKSPDDDGVVKLSLPTEADRVAWTQPGFRLALGFAYGRMEGLRGAPSGRLLGPLLHAGLRLDKDWSIYAAFMYASASAAGGLSALRFAGTIDPTWHATGSLALAIGFGFAGLVEGRTSRMDPDPLGSTLDTSYTFPDASHPLPSCSGVGAAGLARGTYAYVMGPRATFDVELEVFGQYTACIDRTGRVEPDTAQPIIREQYWPHVGVSLALGFMWR